MSNVIIRAERQPDEIPITTAIMVSAFGRENEVKLVETLRDSSEAFHPELSIVAAEEDQVVGYALYCKTIIEGQPSALLTTIGVLPDKQRQGVGERLVRHGLERCRGLGLELVFVLGFPKYFENLGFQPALPLGINTEFTPAADQCLQVIDLSGKFLGKVKGILKIPAEISSPKA